MDKTTTTPNWKSLCMKTTKMVKELEVENDELFEKLTKVNKQANEFVEMNKALAEQIDEAIRVNKAFAVENSMLWDAVEKRKTKKTPLVNWLKHRIN